MTVGGQRILFEAILTNESITGCSLSPYYKENVDLYDAVRESMEMNRFRGSYSNVRTYKARGDDWSNIKKLRIILSDLRTNTEIKELDLSRQKMTPEISEIVSGLLENNKSIETLDISGCGLDDSNSQLLIGLSKNKSVKKLIIYNNSIQIEGARSLREWFASGVSPYDLSLRSCLSDGDSFRVVFQGMTFVSSLTTIDLSRNNLCEGQLGEVIKEAKYVKRLVLHECNIKSTALKSIGEGMCANTTIEELSLNGNKFGSYKDVENSRYRREGLANIARSRSLRSLSLSSCGINSDDVRALFEGLEDSTSLKYLNLSSNEIDTESCGPISYVLMKSGISSLNLSCNKIGDDGDGDGAKMIGLALAKSVILTNLDLSHNKIGNIGAKGFRRGLKFNTSLKDLDLSYNNIGDDGAKKIGNALKINSSLTTLNLSGNKDISDIFSLKLEKALEINTVLKSISLSDTKVSSYMIKKIKELFEIPPLVKKEKFKSVMSLRGGSSRTRDVNDRYNDSDSDNDSDDEDMQYEPSSKQSCPSVPDSKPKPSVSQKPFMFAKEPSDDEPSSGKSAHKTRTLYWKSTEELCKWVKEMFPENFEKVCKVFLENDVTWDTLCGESPDELVKYGLSKEEADKFYESIKVDKLFFLPGEKDPYMTIEEIVHAFNYNRYDLNKVEKIVKKSTDFRKRFNLSIGDVIAIALYTLNSDVNGKTIYSMINSKISLRQSKREYRWYVFYLLFALRKLDPFINIGNLYRGISREVSLGKYKNGKSRKWIPFTSTTKDILIAERFIDYKSYTLFEIRGPVKGYDIQPLSCFDNESEVILEPYFTFKPLATEERILSPTKRVSVLVIESELKDEFFVPDDVIKKIALREPMYDGWQVRLDTGGRICYVRDNEMRYDSPSYTDYEVFLGRLDRLNSHMDVEKH